MAIPLPDGRYNTVAIDPDVSRRARIKEATGSANVFKSCTVYSCITEAYSHFEKPGDVDVVFLSERIAESDLKDFFLKSKSFKSVQDAVLISLIGSTSSRSPAMSLLNGFEGCLMEPYSANALIEITNLAKRIKKDRQISKEQAIISLVIKDILSRVDEGAYLASAGQPSTLALKRLRESCHMLRSFTPEQIGTYFSKLIAACEHATTAGSGAQAYKGASSRVKKRTVQKLLDEDDFEQSPQQ